MFIFALSLTLLLPLFAQWFFEYLDEKDEDR